MEDQPKRGIVYILTNAAMEGYIKIGRTSGETPDDVVRRVQQLDGTNLPRPFDCLFAAVVDNCDSVERSLHEVFADRRVRSNREFFEGVPVASAIAALKMVAIADATPKPRHLETENGKVVEERPPRLPPFRFSLARIPIGAPIHWYNDLAITCEVVSDRGVIYNGRETSLSAAAQEILGWDWSPAGPQYWIYEGETLSDRRRRIESESDDA